MTDHPQDPPTHPDHDMPKPPLAIWSPLLTPTRKPNRLKPGKLPPWKVVLHNDDLNGMGDVVVTITMLTPLSQQAAVRRMLDAHSRGRTLLLTTHRERAELYKDQFASRGLTVTIEPA